MFKRLQLKGLKFNRLTVLDFVYIRNKRTYWKCLCGCGTEVIVCGLEIKGGYTKPCGCLSREITVKRNKLGQSEESRRKQSEKMKGRKYSEEHKRRISEGGKGKHSYLSGINHPNWNSNLTKEERIDKRKLSGYNTWRFTVYKRDNYTCQCCGDDKGGNLNTRHVESYDNNPDLRIEVSNGITLCETCHKDFHHQYGYGMNTREQFNIFVSGR